MTSATLAPRPRARRRLMAQVLARLLASVLLLGSLAAPVAAQQLVPGAATEVNRQARVALQGDDLDGKDGPFAKLTPDLAVLYYEYQAHRQAGKAVAAFQTATRARLGARSATVVVDAATETPGALADRLRRLGARGVAQAGYLVSARVPIARLPDLAQTPALRFARASVALTSGTEPSAAAALPGAALPGAALPGATVSQGDAALRADVARQVFGVDGTGLTVGVLSDSYDNAADGPLLTSAADDIASGDLPPAGRITVLADSVAGIDEGRAMMQLVHDVAPGADLAFHTASGGQAAFATGILGLAGLAGDGGVASDVIVDDIIYLAEPMFQDGVVAQAAQMASDAGIPYFSSAGNRASQSYESVGFREATDPLPPGILGYPEDTPLAAHDFDPGPGVDTRQEISIPVGVQFFPILQWDQPFFSVSGPPGAATDLDILLLDQSGTIVAGSIFDNAGNDAVDGFSFTNDGTVDADGDGQPDTTFDLVITRRVGPAPGRIKYVNFDRARASGPTEFDTRSSTSYGHNHAAGAAGVAATFYGDTPVFGQDPALPRGFTSRGGTPILFDTEGNRLTEPEDRQQPRFTAPDGTNTTFFLAGNDPEGDGFPNFPGTSAAAPHAAAVAALMLEFDGTLSPQAVYDVLAFSAQAFDMDDPLTPGFDTGFDRLTGAGLIQADRALTRLVPAPVLSVSPDEVNFGTLFLGAQTPDEVTVRVTNAGGEDLQITEATVTGTGFSFVPGEAVPTETFPPGTSADAQIRFDPPATGPFTGTLTLTTNATAEPVEIPLTGEAVDAPEVTVTPAALGTVALSPGGTVSGTLTVGNDGLGALDFQVFASLDLTPEAPGPVTQALAAAVEAPPATTGTLRPDRARGDAMRTSGASGTKAAAGAPKVAEDFLYQIDDGTAETAIGTSGGGDIMWLNGFRAVDGEGLVTALASAWGGTLPAGTPATLILYDDPDDDGVPDDLVRLAEVATTAQQPGTDAFTAATIEPTLVEGVFFIAALVRDHADGVRPAPVDLSSGSGQASWTVLAGPNALNVDDLPSNGLFGQNDQIGLPGNWLLRAEGSQAVQIAPAAGTIASGDPAQTIALTFQTEGLPEGVYPGNIVVVSNDPQTPAVEVPVTQVVAETFAQATVSASGPVSFGATGLRADLVDVAGAADITVARFDDPPEAVAGIASDFAGDVNVSPYRWAVVADADALFGFDASEVRFDLSALPDGGGITPGDASLTVYQRAVTGAGAFDALDTSLDDGDTPGDPSDDVVVASGVTGFSEFVFASDASPLPVELAAFEVTSEDAVPVLAWTTASETANAGFEVQRAVDGGAFAPVGFVEGHGTTSEAHTYRYADAGVPYDARRVTYRLRQVDLDGRARLHDARTLDRGVPGQVELRPVYPNPTRDRATVAFGLPARAEVELAVYDALGRRVATLARGEHPATRHTVTLRTQGLASGVYFVRLVAGHTVHTRRLTVVR